MNETNKSEKHVPQVTFDEVRAHFLPVSTALSEDMLVLDDITPDLIGTLPSQISFLLIGLCTSGEITFTMGERQWKLEPGDLVISLADPVLFGNACSPDFRAKAVIMSRSFAQNGIAGMDKMWPYLLHIMANPVLRLTPDEQSWVSDCHELIRRRLNRAPGRYLHEATVALTRAFYYEVCNLLDKRVHPNNSPRQTRAYALFDRFIRLVSQNFKRERTVEWYSNELCVTAKHLSEVVKQVSGKTAGQWIQTIVVVEIKTLLSQSSLSIKEIADEMNFSNQSFLGKYFKNVEGISPTDYRKA